VPFGLRAATRASADVVARSIKQMTPRTEAPVLREGTVHCREVAYS
jgi:hypothetical protein